jgi:two-component system, LuxR family, sensor histidine kinase DctS
MKTPIATTSGAAAPWRWRRPALWVALVVLLVLAQSLLVALALNYEATRAQDRVDEAAASAASELRRTLARDLQQLQSLLWNDPSPPQWKVDATEMLHQRRELLRIEMRDPHLNVIEAIDTPYGPAPFGQIPRQEADLETRLACAAAQREGSPRYSRSYFLPFGAGLGSEVLDLCMPVQRGSRLIGYMAATLVLSGLLEEAIGEDIARHHALSIVEGDGTRLASAGHVRGSGVFRAERVIELPGFALQLRLDSDASRPSLIPNLATGLVLGLSLALACVVALLARDTGRRARAEAAVAEALAFRKAMEDSLVTGLRARDLQGRITYVNPAFCELVGFSASELLHEATPPYWPPERVAEYDARKTARLGATPPSREVSRLGFETEFMRRDGERFPVLIFEAPLVDGAGTHTGWMSAVLDLSAQRRIEEISRQQQEKLQATARLAMMGEMASLLSHELNQPLAAIASYAAGTLNLLNEEAPGPTRTLLLDATARIAEQAERAGRVIRSVHDFVRRRERARETVAASELFDAVLPLIRLQARKSGARVRITIAGPMPHVVCDRTMIEQVLLNLARNGLQAMDAATPLAARELALTACIHDARRAGFAVSDHGRGIAPEVAERLFTPFFTTRPEGLGLGLSLCRTVVEQHGGTLEHDSRTNADDLSTTEFRFTLALAMD